jgi:cell division protein FtsL
MIPKNKRNPKSPESIFFSTLFILLILMVSTFLIISNLKINQKRAELNAQIERLKEETQTLEEKNQKLKATISESEKEDYLEKEARERLGLKKPGEEAVVILPSKNNEKENIQEKKNFLEKILEKILDLLNFQ